MATIRHTRFHQNIVDNLRRNLSGHENPEIHAVDDDLLYWAYEGWSGSEDFPDESQIPLWLSSAEKESDDYKAFLLKKHAPLTEDEVIEYAIAVNRKWLARN